MHIQKVFGFSMAFGQAADFPIEHAKPEFYYSCTHACAEFSCESLVVQEQVHGTDGLYIDQAKAKGIYIKESIGDYLITDQPGIAISVLTADCLPIVILDTKHHVAAIVHAGWKSSVAGIVTKVIEHMTKKRVLGPCDIQCYFGPCARRCCYEVQEDFIHNLKVFPWYERVIELRNDAFYFDLSLFNKLHLIDLGIDPSHIHMHDNQCTICNHAYHSNRRNGHARLCQLSVVCC